jgi:hypothetical protein
MDKTLISQLPPLAAAQGVASGIATAELSAAELDRVTGGRPASGPIVTCPTCSYGVVDDCGSDPFA